MVSLKIIILFISAAIAIPFAKRDVTGLVADIASVASTFNTVVSSTNKFANDGSVANGISIYVDVAFFKNAITHLTSDFNSHDPLSEVDAKAVLDAILAVAPSLGTAVEALKKAEPNFAEKKVKDRVLTHLHELKIVTDQNAAALLAKVPTDKRAQVTAINNAIDAVFDQAAAPYIA